MPTAAEIVSRAASRAWAPPPELSIWQWADKNRRLSADSPEKGNYESARTPYMREVMDVLSPSHPARWAALLKGVQSAGTTAALNWLGYSIDQDPTPFLITLQDESAAREWSDQRITQLIDTTPCLQGKITGASKTTRDARFLKRIAGTHATIKMAWATSAKKMRSMPAGNLISDEVDAYVDDPDGEGSVLALLDGRRSNWPRSKHFMLSTPTREPSKIYGQFLRGDQRYYFVPCPHCGRFQSFIDPYREFGWVRFRFVDGIASYQCIGCQQWIPEHCKTEILARGIWVPTRDDREIFRAGFQSESTIAPAIQRGKRAEFASFRTSSAYNPMGWYGWAEMLRDWELVQGNPSELKSFINLRMGDVWQVRGKALDDEKIWARREYYPHFSLGGGAFPWNSSARVPKRVLFLTAAVDVQQNPARLEVSLKGWGRDKEAWGIGYWIFEGDVSRIENEPWQKLDQLLNSDFPCESGPPMAIWAMAIDTGFLAPVVYDFAARHYMPAYSDATGTSVPELRTVIPTAGYSGYTQNIIASVSTTDAARKRSNVRIWKAGTVAIKAELFGWLSLLIPEDLNQPYPKYQHYPDYGREWFKQLCSEHRKVKNGVPYYEKLPGRERNEALDTEVYHRLAAAVIGVDQFDEEFWKSLEQMRAERAPTPQIAKRRERDESGGYFGGDGGGGYFSGGGGGYF